MQEALQAISVMLQVQSTSRVLALAREGYLRQNHVFVSKVHQGAMQLEAGSLSQANYSLQTR
jgi:hypothetical protein